MVAIYPEEAVYNTDASTAGRAFIEKPSQRNNFEFDADNLVAAICAVASKSSLFFWLGSGWPQNAASPF